MINLAYIVFFYILIVEVIIFLLLTLPTPLGFKSKLVNPNANQWITTANGSFNIWNWIELYGDLGLIKNKSKNGHFVYDSGIRLNFVSDYFELYLPIYSNNGLEINQRNYNEKIRFVVTFSPKTLINLFNRKWF